MMLSLKISEKAPLIYYSYQQVINEDDNIREINAANKITIRKHADYSNNGLELLIYNCALGPYPELCNGIRQTDIVADNVRIDFEGKGLSGNGVPLNNLYGCFLNNKGMLELVTAKKNRKYSYHYLNCYRNEHPDVFVIDVKHLDAFFRSTFELLDDYEPFNTWIMIRICLLEYYTKKGMCLSKSNFFSEEWAQRNITMSDDVKILLLKDFEEILDLRFYEAFKLFRKGDHFKFQKAMDDMIMFQGVYYLIYSTLL